MKNKDQIANEIYCYDFDLLSAGEKANVTKKWKAQPQRARATRATRTPIHRNTPITSTIDNDDTENFVKVTIGRVNSNGTKTCLLAIGSTVDDLLAQSGFSIDKNKEGVISQTYGVVKFTDKLVDKETYVIAVGVNSA